MLTPEGDIHPDLTSEPAGASKGAAAGPSHDRNVDAFAEFFSKEFTKVVQFLLYQGAQFAEATDVTQDAMLDVFKNWDRIENPFAYVRKAAVRIFIRYRTRQRSEAKRAASVAPSNILEESFDDLEDAQWVLQQLRELPRTQAAVMSLHMDGFSSQEIAEVTGTSVATVRSNLRHARTILRAKLQARMSPDDDTPRA